MSKMTFVASPSIIRTIEKKKNIKKEFLSIFMRLLMKMIIVFTVYLIHLIIIIRSKKTYVILFLTFLNNLKCV